MVSPVSSPRSKTVDWFASLGYHQPPSYPEPGLHEWWEEGFYAAIAAGEAAPSLYSTLGDSAEAAASRHPSTHVPDKFKLSATRRASDAIASRLLAGSPSYLDSFKRTASHISRFWSFASLDLNPGDDFCVFTKLFKERCCNQRHIVLRSAEHINHNHCQARSSDLQFVSGAKHTSRQKGYWYVSTINRLTIHIGTNVDLSSRDPHSRLLEHARKLGALIAVRFDL